MNRSFAFLCTGVALAAFLSACDSRVDKGAAPDEHHFRKVVLAEGLPQPVMIDLDARNRIYVAESVGNLMIFDQQKNQFTKAGFLPTYDGNEFGLIGMKLDPHFDDNGFIYLHYFRKDTVRMECISRFTMKDDSLVLASEKNYLQIRHDNTCCHTGGGMTFDAQGNLYIATGDNTDAFFTHYALTDDEPGHLFDDALRSAGNTNDYRGKILRIHPEPDGSYTIPKGNLFPPGTDSTKPEIYIMGVRNPFRIYVDQQTGYLYWGEVGPDGAKDSSRGPRGYDEFNQARKAGNFGWPLFIGRNFAYNHVYFGDHERIGEKFDTAHPVNFSRNNTGLTRLPPAHPAFMWYPYDSSKEFPSFGSGGRVAIGGPVYHYDEQLDSKVKFPKYFDGCWFIAEWMRNWIKAAHLDADGQLSYLDDFMPGTVFKKPMCMQFGRDGALYLLEYGSSWGANPDTKLVRIEYIPDNLPPVARIHVDRTYGKAPLTVHFSAEGSLDYDHDSLQYIWTGGRGDTLARGMQAAITFDQPGKYPVQLAVQDPHGGSSRLDTTIWVGNDLPAVALQMPNHSFYWDSIRYAVEVKDAEDGTLQQGIAAADVQVTLQQLPPGSSYEGHGVHMSSRGERLVAENDCKACHQLDRQSVGPSFMQVAEKYHGDAQAIPRLAEKILHGGSGVWGEASMSPHPQLTMAQTTEIVRYIYSLGEKRGTPKTLPLQGVIKADGVKDPTEAQGYYVLQAAYTDKGGNQIGPLTGYGTVILRSPTIGAVEFDQIYDAQVNGGSLNGINNSHGMIRQLDLSAIRTIRLSARGGQGASIEVRLDSATGFLAGSANFDASNDWQLMDVPISPVSGMHDVYFVFRNRQRFQGISLRWVRFLSPTAAPGDRDLARRRAQ